jgi:hypothetical protein
MAKNLKFNLAGKAFEAGITKVDRDKVYGYVEEIITDLNGNPCATASLLDDGVTLILSGATSLKIVNEHIQEVDKKALKTVYMDGSDAVLVPSSFDHEIELQEAVMEDLFNLEVSSVYQLMWDDTLGKDEMLKALESNRLFRFIFNYRADYEGADAILLGSQNELFILTGRLLSFDYLENKPMVINQDQLDITIEDDDMDFGML